MHIWNPGESGVQDIPKEEKVIGVMGEKVHTMSPKERGETTTILMFANACGQVLPTCKGTDVVTSGSPSVVVCSENY